MSVYWENALTFSQTGTPKPYTVAMFPPFYSFFLSAFLKLIQPTSLMPYAHPIGLLIHVLLSTVSVYALYSISCHVTKSKTVSLWVCFVYAFSPLVLYLNSLFLAENISTPFLFVACALFLKEEPIARKKIFYLMISGLSLGIAVAGKPGLIFLFFAFLLHLLFTQKRPLPVVFLQLFLFLFSLSLAPAFTVIKNYQISEGKVVGLGANGGLNFFQGACKYQKITSDSDEGLYWASSPALSSKPEWGEFKTQEPYHNQAYFYKMGLNCFKESPLTWLEKISDLGNLYTSYVGPGPSDRMEFIYLLVFNRWVLIFASALLFLFPFGASLQGIESQNLKFLLTLLLLYLATIAIFTLPERRYIATVEPMIYLLCALVIEQVYKSWKLKWGSAPLETHL